MFRFYALRVLKDYIGHVILIGLPVVLISLMVMINQEATGIDDVGPMALYIGIIYIIMFQGFGSAYTFEGVEHDFFKPFRDRLRAAPIHPMSFILMNILFGIIISFLQSMVLLTFVVIVFKASIPNLFFVLIVLFLGVLFAQLLAASCILVFKKASKAQSVITMYIIGAMIVAGFFFPLPENGVTIFLSKYSSPMAWTHLATYGFIDGVTQNVVIGLSLLGVSILALVFVVYRLSQKVVR
jgi:ABC-2 type transport system permease protein